MVRQSVLALALCALLALAGCNGIFGPDATTPADTTNAPAADSPPGLLTNGVGSPSALADAHGDALRNTSFAVAVTWNATRNGSLVAHRNVTRRVAAGGTPWAGTSDLAGGLVGVAAPTHVASWTNATTQVTRVTQNETTRTTVGNASTDMTPEITRHSRVHGLYLSFSFGVNRTDDGFALTATGVRQPDAISSRFSNVSNVSLTMHLDDAGLVRSYALAFDARGPEGDEYRVVETFELTQVGNVTVERPPWVEEALNRSG